MAIRRRIETEELHLGFKGWKCTGAQLNRCDFSAKQPNSGYCELRTSGEFAHSEFTPCAFAWGEFIVFMRGIDLF